MQTDASESNLPPKLKYQTVQLQVADVDELML